jgi:hypothetical protein
VPAYIGFTSTAHTMMPSLKSLSLPEARRHLKMNLSILEMLKGNTEPNDLAKLRELWVVPYEELVQDLSREFDHGLSGSSDVRP